MRDRLQVNVVQVDTCTGISQQCPPPTIKVEKVNGGLRLFGVVIGNNCQVSLPAFGVLFSFIGIILSIVAFKEADIDENPLEISNREETVRNIRILGPVCIVVGVLMIILGVTLKYLSRKAQDKETKIGFYCPVHGDFYPLSPNINPRKYSFSEIARTENKWWSSLSLGCLKKNHQSCEPIVSADIPPCPHSISPSNRSSFDGQHVHISNLNPNTIIITAATTTAASSIRDRDGARSGSMASDLDAAETSLQNQSYTSTRSLSVPNDVASFPSFRSRSNPPTSPPSPIYTPVASNAKRLSCPILPEIGAVSPLQIQKLNKPTSVLTNPKTELKIVQPAVTTVLSVLHSPSKTVHMSISSDDESKKRKSVSILLPDNQYGVN